MRERERKRKAQAFREREKKRKRRFMGGDWRERERVEVGKKFHKTMC